MKATCELCPNHCVLDEGAIGICRARANRNGSIVCENYGKLTSLALDPIEKKPLARYMPGSMILSVGSFGCNLHCPFCQNASIAAAGEDEVSWTYVPPEQLVEQALLLKDKGNIGIAYTYNEPFVSFEYVLDCARLAHSAGLKNVLVTNGMICREPLEQLLPFIDAMNIDLKGFTQEVYRAVGGDLATVKATIELAARSGCHVEVTTLIVPGFNDDAAQIEELSAWLAAIDPCISYHVSRFFPCYKMQDRPATPLETVHAMADVARRHLSHVYTGNC